MGGRPARCVECNLELETLAADRVPASVPAYVRATQHDFRRCVRCRRVYWPATHRARMEAEIAALALSPPGDAHA
jgi:hypothetical protein